MWTSCSPIVRLTPGRVRLEQPTYIDTVEFVSSIEDSDNLLPDEPLNIVAYRIEGVGDVRPSLLDAKLVEAAPDTNSSNGYAKWSARGFYGEKNRLITRLGVV
ncbi:hypothetical protein F5Y05DRAFT_343065 [Hypoxylon sp. FL0543]|nr:hypothetical protein F5Y05DRAFT_343065 [Hypoxylon sp. FL0543]